MALGRAPAAALLCLIFVCSLPVERVVADEQLPDRRAPTRVVHLDDSACGGVPRSELRELVTLELAPRVLRAASDDSAEADTTDVRLSCDAEVAHIVVREAARSPQELVLDLSSIELAARARLIALTLAELLATADMEPIAPAPTAAAAQPEPAAERATAGTHVWLAAGLAREGSPRVLAPSLQTGLVLNLAGLPLAIVAELDAQRGARNVAAGGLTLWTVSGALGPAAQLALGPLALVLAGGVRLGYARLVGEPEAGQTAITGHAVSGRWWGPALGVSATWPLTTRLGLRAGLDLSWIARPVRGTDSTERTAFALDGLLLQATLGATFALR